MKWAEDNLDILQNLEFAVVEVSRAHPEMADYAAQRAYEAAFQLYRAEQRGHQPKPSNLTGLDATVFEALKAMCEFRLGRGPGLNTEPADPVPPITVEKLTECLRELAKSVERHTKTGGHRGYLIFIDGFLP